ncbi:DEAD/DEAH box helicase [Streptomyces caniscabiei]|uniref:DEAD/DEAH box helicase n=1 Tax=Streptomyces caniscabiei TaxID=2746961 RepID=UPI0029A34191|nr:DEAD/DEAH box helicase [Streptomyces caniscabiei]MDX2775854.1 DEAD/DEAH box helicase [Streptomyces caniscabiei]
MAFQQRRGGRPMQGRSQGGRSFGGGRRGGGSRGPAKKYIHPSKFINKAVQKADEIPYEATHKFADFPFGAQLHHNIASKGYVTPSAIQDQAIPHIIDGKDVIGLANTGTGKTAAFLLPIIERQSGITLRPSVLIIAPTRELAQQIDEQFRDFSKGLGLYSTLIVGGVNVDRQIRDLKRRPHVIIGTPGRLKDLMQRRVLQLKNMTTLVLDEADRMLDMGFLPDIRQIIGEMPTDRQTLFFSATITPEISALVNTFLKDPVTVSVRTTETSEHVEQDIVETRDKTHKMEVLIDMLSNEAFEKVLVFGETKFGVQRLSDHLDNSGIPSAAIHGNKNQSQRQRALKQFKDERVRVLVATDVAARGLDIPNVTHVINFDTPQTYEDYVHRIGRTGRGGARGHAFTFIDPR